MTVALMKMFLEAFKSHLDVVMGTLLWVSLIEQEWDQMDPEVPSNLNHSVVLCFCDLLCIALSSHLLPNFSSTG